MSDDPMIDIGKIKLPNPQRPYGEEAVRGVGELYEAAAVRSDRIQRRRAEAFPELLAACKAWVDYFDRLTRDDEPGDPLAAARNHYHRARIEQTRAAIAKAEARS